MPVANSIPAVLPQVKLFRFGLICIAFLQGKASGAGSVRRTRLYPIENAILMPPFDLRVYARGLIGSRARRLFPGASRRHSNADRSMLQIRTSFVVQFSQCNIKRAGRFFLISFRGRLFVCLLLPFFLWPSDLASQMFERLAVRRSGRPP